MGWKDSIQDEDQSPAPKSWRDTVQDEEPGVGTLEASVRGGIQGLPLVGSWADEAEGGVRSMLPGGGSYDDEVKKVRGEYDAAADANPLAYYGAGAAVNAPIDLAKKIPLAGPALGALEGAVYGLGSGEGMEDSLKDAGIGAATGAIIPRALQLGGKAVGKGVSKVGQMLGKGSKGAGEMAESLAARALGAERGTVKSMGIDDVRAAGKYALDEGIIDEGLKSAKNPLNWFGTSSVDDMIQKNDSVMGKAMSDRAGAYDSIDDLGASMFNPLEVAGQVEDKVGDFWRSPLNKDQTKQFENTLESVLMRGDKSISLKEAQLLKEELGKVANWKNNVSVTDKERMARDTYGVVADALTKAGDDGAKLADISGVSDLINKSNQTYSKGAGAAKLLENRQAREQGNKLVGLTDSIAGGSGFAALGPAGLAAIPVKKGFERYGPALGAKGALNISKTLKEAPETFGKFAATLQKAAERGETATAATHYILQQTQPEYRKMMGLGDDQDEEQ